MNRYDSSQSSWHSRERKIFQQSPGARRGTLVWLTAILLLEGLSVFGQGPLRLSIHLITPSRVQISWNGSPDLVLEQSSSLALWQEFPGFPQLKEAESFVLADITEAAQFFRLRTSELPRIRPLSLREFRLALLQACWPRRNFSTQELTQSRPELRKG
jgi:hypothetical protein